MLGDVLSSVVTTVNKTDMVCTHVFTIWVGVRENIF